MNDQDLDKFVASLGIEPGDLNRVVLHWNGGGAFPDAKSRRAYHAMIDQRGGLHTGTFSVDDNIDTGDEIYAAHTLHGNTKAFGLALCGMHGAVENPLDFGPSPINEEQFNLSARLTARILMAAALPVERHTALSHAEVESVLGIKQRGKWDLSVLPWRSDIRGATAVGNLWRSMIREEMKNLGQVVTFVTDPFTMLRPGNKTPNAQVKLLQNRLAELGYHSGKIDGLYGSRTRAAVLAFQADHNLVTDGIAGPLTLSALYSNKAEPLPLRDVTEEDLRAGGSETIKQADRVKQAGVLTATVGSAQEVLGSANEAIHTVEQAQGIMDRVQYYIVEYWPVLIFIGIGLALWHFGQRVSEERLRSAKTGENTRL